MIIFQSKIENATNFMSRFWPTHPPNWQWIYPHSTKIATVSQILKIFFATRYNATRNWKSLSTTTAKKELVLFWTRFFYGYTRDACLGAPTAFKPDFYLVITTTELLQLTTHQICLISLSWWTLHLAHDPILINHVKNRQERRHFL